MRVRVRELVGPALFEASFVVLGVILALAANEWREAREHRRDAEDALRAIRAELAANRTTVESSRAYHAQLLSSLGGRPATEPSPTINMFTRGFVSPAQVTSTAWNVASETGVLSHIPYPTVLKLSRAYALQNRYDDQSRNIAQLIYSELYRQGPMAMAANYRNLLSLIGAFAFRERELVILYDSTLTEQGTGAELGAGR